MEKDDLLAAVAHDIKSPMTCIIGYTSLLLERPQSEADRQALARIAAAARWALAIASDLTDASAVENGGLRLETAPVDLAALAREAAADFAVRCEAARVSLSTALPPGPVLVVGDPARLAQVLHNLLQNALKHTRAGGHVRVGVEAVGPEAVVLVSDDGEGIAPADQPRIFEKFYQARPGWRGGIGLGLFMAREIVERHGGRIGVRSGGLGTGAAFHVALPRFDPARAYEAYREERAAPTPRPHPVSR